jgi:hypothetical protein
MGKVFVQTNEADGNRVIVFEGGEKTARSPSLKASRPAARATVFRTSRPKARSSLLSAPRRARPRPRRTG